jgi:hypothetical protein
MKSRIMLFMFALVASSASTQSVPNFTGEWTLIPEKSSFPESRPEGSRVQVNIVHDSDGIQSNWTIASSSDRVELKLRFTTDGAPTFNSSGRNEKAFELLAIPADKTSLGERIEVTSRWKGHQLNVVSKWYNPNKRGVELDDTWTLSTDKNTLTINRTSETEHPTTDSPVTEAHILVFQREALRQKQTNAQSKIANPTNGEPRQYTQRKSDTTVVQSTVPPIQKQAPSNIHSGNIEGEHTVQPPTDCSSGGSVSRDGVYRNGATPQLGDCSSLDNSVVQGNGRDSKAEIVGGKESRITHNTQEGFDNPSIHGGDNAEISGNLQRKHQDTSSTQDKNGNGADMDDIRAAQTAIVYECRDRECCHGTPFTDTPIPRFNGVPTAVAINGENNSVVADGLANLLRRERKANDPNAKKDWLTETRTFLTANLGQQFTDAFDNAHDSSDVLVIFENELRAAACN